MKLASGHIYEEMEPSEKEEYQKDFTGFINDLVILKPGGWVLPRRYFDYQERLYNFKFRPGDVVIMTYPKCGTTWTQEIVWTMLHNPNLDNEESKLPLWARTPFIEADMLFPPGVGETDEMGALIFKKFQELCPDKSPDEGLQLSLTEALPDRRAIKTHLPFSLLSPDLLSTAKVVFVARNPKDTLLSFQHHQRLLKGHDFKGTQDAFVDWFVKDRLLHGSFGEMIREAWAVREHPNLHFVFYEDMKADIDGELKKIDKFIGTGLTEQQLKNVRDHTTIGSMKARDPVKFDSGNFYNKDVAEKDGKFIRNGQSGSWRGKFTAEQEAKIDAYTKTFFDGTGLTFKY